MNETKENFDTNTILKLKRKIINEIQVVVSLLGLTIILTFDYDLRDVVPSIICFFAINIVFITFCILFKNEKPYISVVSSLLIAILLVPMTLVYALVYAILYDIFENIFGRLSLIVFLPIYGCFFVKIIKQARELGKYEMKVSNKNRFTETECISIYKIQAFVDLVISVIYLLTVIIRINDITYNVLKHAVCLLYIIVQTGFVIFGFSHVDQPKNKIAVKSLLIAVLLNPYFIFELTYFIVGLF